MNKRIHVLAIILLLAAGLVVNYLSGHSDGSVDKELIDLFAGILIGAGLTLLVQLFFPKRKIKQQT